MMNPLPLVQAGFRKSLVQTLGILVLLSLVFALGIGVSQFQRGFQDATATEAQDVDLIIGGPGSQLGLVMSAIYLQQNGVLPLVAPAILDQLKADPRVKYASPLVLADSWKGYPLVGVGTDFPALRPSLKLAQGHWPDKPYQLVVGSATGLEIGDEIEGEHGIEAEEEHEEDHEAEGGEEHHSHGLYTVVGLLENSGTTWDRALITPAESIWMVHEHQSGTASAPSQPLPRSVSAILVKPATFPAAYSLRDQYQTGSTTAAFPGEVLSQVFGVLAELKTVFSGLGLALQAVVFAAVLLSLMASLPGKIRWISLLRSLGAGRLYVFLVVWLESGLVFLFAGLSGSVLGTLASQGLGLWLHSRTGLGLGVTWSWDETLMVLIFWIAGLLAALIPALKAYRTSPLD